MESPARTQAVKRTTFLAGGAALWAVAIFGKLFYVQIVRHKHYAEIANQQQLEMVDLPGPRGSIFDRNGEIFAMSEPVESVYVSPMRLPNLNVAADVMAPVLHLNRDQLYARLKSAYDDRKRHGFLWVKRKITREEKADIQSLRLPWIKLQEDSVRRYPKLTVASHVIGSVDFAEKGNAGLELGLDKELRGEAGSAQMLTDVNKRGIESEMYDAPKVGTDLVLTIDERIQSAAERDLKDAAERNHARTGTVVVMNPRNGEILAMASYPTFDPNRPPEPGEPRFARLNRAVAAPFEPGSVFKVITLATALETTDLRPDSILPCGSMKMFHRVIHEAHHAYGPLSMADVLAKSSNVGAIQIGMKIGKEKLYEYIRRFGFGQKTGTGLPAESGGMLRRLEKWQPGSICSIPMGHEVSVTALQLAQACSVVANGGLMIKPKLILKRQRPGQPAEELKSEPPVRIIKPETAFTMRQMMEGVVVLKWGTGHRTARLDGYSSAGKTGSAQIYDYAARHYTKNYNASFMGFAPVTNPAIVVVVTLNGTSGNAGMGGAAAGPVFRTVAMEALRVLDVPKDIPDLEPDVEEDKGHKFNGNDVAIAGLSDPPPLEEDEEAPRVFGPAPPPAAEKPKQAQVNGPRVPNFQGMTMRAVVEEAGAMGLPVSLDGRGVARMQVPPPGAVLPPGGRIRVVFAR
jgi:cell division protein FtsI (penicillin-binding protein 3)